MDRDGEVVGVLEGGDDENAALAAAEVRPAGVGVISLLIRYFGKYGGVLYASSLKVSAAGIDNFSLGL